MDLENLDLLNIETIEILGLKIEHSLHSFEETEISKLSVPGFGEWVLFVIEDQLLVLLLGGIPENMKQKFCLNFAELPDREVSRHEIIENFVSFLLESFAQIETGIN